MKDENTKPKHQQAELSKLWPGDPNPTHSGDTAGSGAMFWAREATPRAEMSHQAFWDKSFFEMLRIVSSRVESENYTGLSLVESAARLADQACVLRDEARDGKR